MSDHVVARAMIDARTDAGQSCPPSVLACVLALIVVKCSLGMAGVSRTVRGIEWLTRHRAWCDVIPSELVYAADHAVAIAAALYPGRALCLEQSLVLYFFLRRSGVPAELRIGVHPYPFSAHAWVELNGIPVNDVEEHVVIYRAFRASASRR